LTLKVRSVVVVSTPFVGFMALASEKDKGLLNLQSIEAYRAVIIVDSA